MLDAVNVNARALLGKAYKIIHEYQKAEEHLTNAILIENDQAHLYAGAVFLRLYRVQIQIHSHSVVPFLPSSMCS